MKKEVRKDRPVIGMESMQYIQAAGGAFEQFKHMLHSPVEQTQTICRHNPDISCQTRSDMHNG